MPSVEICQHTFRLNFLERLCTQEDGNDDFWKEDTRQSFSSLESAHMDEVNAQRSPWYEYSFYQECRNTMRYLLQVKDHFSSIQALSPRALYRWLLKINSWASSALQIWSFAPSHLSSPGWNVLITTKYHSPGCVGKKLCAANLTISSECVRCGYLEEYIGHVFFQCSFARPLCRLTEVYIIRVLDGNFFALEANSVCTKVVPLLKRNQLYLLLCPLNIMRIMV